MKLQWDKSASASMKLALTTAYSSPWVRAASMTPALLGAA